MSIASSTPTTTSSVDVSDFWQMLEKEDNSIPCEADPKYWHTVDAPAVWATWWDFECAHRGMLFICDPCMVKIYASTAQFGICGACGRHFSGTLVSHLTRQERIK